MRLLNTVSLELSKPYTPSEVPDYVILSHRWSNDEVTFADLSQAPISDPQSPTRAKAGFAKIEGACALLRQRGYEWIWIDSCCIDKSSSAELQEAINSMWRYYAEANICYVYMVDVPDAEAGWGQAFADSEWFTRGWTLQELIAPVCVEFYAKNWEPIGTKFERYKGIAEITAISKDVLLLDQDIDWFSAAEKLSWAAHRKVTREEDEAYSLLGLFEVNMPLLYGEGREKAFVRLQEAIYNLTSDHSIFLFRYSRYHGAQPLLADSPTRFCARVNCPSCPAQKNRCLPPHIHYGNIVASERWSNQAHEQIMTTVTTARNEISTVLPLLDYRLVSEKLHRFDADQTRRGKATHVAVLNNTLRKHPKGAICLLLWRRDEGTDACVRLQAFPAILPHLGEFVSAIRNTKLLICPASSKVKNASRDSTLFSIKSDLFRVESWETHADSTTDSARPTQAEASADFEVEASTSGSADRISCHLASAHDAALTLTVKLVHMDKTWSIKAAIAQDRGDEGQEEGTRFRSKFPADRCSVKLPDGGSAVSIKLSRLPGAARAHLDEQGAKFRYQVSIDAMDASEAR